MIPKFTYAYTDEMKKLLDSSGNLKAGTIKIETVRNLLLENETAATAQYVVRTDLNPAGSAVSGKTTMSEVRNVIFRRQPDGTWVLPAH